MSWLPMSTAAYKICTHKHYMICRYLYLYMHTIIYIFRISREAISLAVCVACCCYCSCRQILVQVFVVGLLTAKSSDLWIYPVKKFCITWDALHETLPILKPWSQHCTHFLRPASFSGNHGFDLMDKIDSILPHLKLFWAFVSKLSRTHSILLWSGGHIQDYLNYSLIRIYIYTYIEWFRTFTPATKTKNLLTHGNGGSTESTIPCHRRL